MTSFKSCSFTLQFFLRLYNLLSAHHCDLGDSYLQAANISSARGNRQPQILNEKMYRFETRKFVKYCCTGHHFRNALATDIKSISGDLNKKNARAMREIHCGGSSFVCAGISVEQGSPTFTDNRIYLYIFQSLEVY